jgi:hypothetical protein
MERRERGRVRSRRGEGEEIRADRTRVSSVLFELFLVMCVCKERERESERDV